MAHEFRHFLDDIGHNNIIKGGFDPDSCDEASTDAFARKEAQFKSINTENREFYTQVNRKLKYGDIGEIVVSQFLAKGLDRGLQEVDEECTPTAPYYYKLSPWVGFITGLGLTVGAILKGLTIAEGVEEALMQYFKVQATAKAESISASTPDTPITVDDAIAK